MAWEHFTDWLEADDVLTYAQWQELVDAIEERMLATCSGFAWVGDDSERTGMYAVIDAAKAGLRTARACYTRYDGTVSIPNLVDLLFELASAYASTYQDAPMWEADLYFQAQDDLEYDYDEINDLIIGFLDYGLESYKVWNLLRRMVQLLRYPWAKIQAESTKAKSVYVDPDDYPDDFEGWQAAMLSAWLSATEMTQAVVNGYYCDGECDIEAGTYAGSRTVSTIEVPDHPMFDDYEAWIYFDQDVLSHYANDNTQTDSILVTLNSVPFSRVFRYYYGFPQVFDLEQILLLGSGLDAVGSLPVVIALDSYSDGTVANHNIGNGNGAAFLNGWAIEDGVGIYLAPTFTHPFEEIPAS